MISVPFQNNLTPGMGPHGDHTLNVLNIQPVVPFALSKDLTLVTRTILPVLSQPTAAGTQNGIGGRLLARPAARRLVTVHSFGGLTPL